jgi:hypothetical protein
MRKAAPSYPAWPAFPSIVIASSSAMTGNRASHRARQMIAAQGPAMRP